MFNIPVRENYIRTKGEKEIIKTTESSKEIQGKNP